MRPPTPGLVTPLNEHDLDISRNMMDGQSAGPQGLNALSPNTASRNPRLQLPLTTDPPSAQNPPKQLVWLVRYSRPMKRSNSRLLPT